MQTLSFPIVVLDEATQATEPHSLVPLLNQVGVGVAEEAELEERVVSSVDSQDPTQGPEPEASHATRVNGAVSRHLLHACCRSLHGHPTWPPRPPRPSLHTCYSSTLLSI